MLLMPACCAVAALPKLLLLSALLIALLQLLVSQMHVACGVPPPSLLLFLSPVLTRSVACIPALASPPQQLAARQ
jgi:hypothetical protein